MREILRGEKGEGEFNSLKISPNKTYFKAVRNVAQYRISILPEGGGNRANRVGRNRADIKSECSEVEKLSSSFLKNRLHLSVCDTLSFVQGDFLT
jgi:hypothetical protein